MASDDHILSAVSMRLLSAGLFATMNAMIKLAEADGAALGEILFFRQLGAALLLVAILVAGPGLKSVATQRFPAHLWRAILGLSAMACTFSTVLLLPLAESTSLGFTMPIFATILGALILREPTGWHRWAAVAAGFAGVLIVVQPGSGHFPATGIFTGLAAAMLTASVSILLRQISRTEGTMTTVFWFSSLSLVPLGLVYAFVMQPHQPMTWLMLIGIGLVGGGAQLAMTSALRLGPVSVVVPMDYSSLLWAAAYGWLLFGVLPGNWTWLGAPIIVASGLYIVWREQVRRSRQITEVTAQV